MKILDINYTKQEVLRNIKAIEELREENITLPLAILRKEEPKRFSKAYHKGYMKIYRKTPEYKKRKKDYHKSIKFKEYTKERSKALHILKARHLEEFNTIREEIRKGRVIVSNENSNICSCFYN